MIMQIMQLQTCTHICVISLHEGVIFRHNVVI